jgi:hypothetical protein
MESMQLAARGSLAVTFPNHLNCIPFRMMADFLGSIMVVFNLE